MCTDVTAAINLSLHHFGPTSSSLVEDSIDSTSTDKDTAEPDVFCQLESEKLGLAGMYVYF